MKNSPGAAIVGGVPVDDLTLDEVLALIDQFVVDGRASGRTFQIATVNVDFVVNALADPELMRILRRAEVCLPDGMPIVWHAKLCGTPLRERVPGADLVPALVARSVTPGHRVLLFGSAEGVAEKAAEQLRQRSPGAVIRGVSGPVFSDVTQVHQSSIDEIRRFAPDIICVALGNPKQEKWIETNRCLAGAAVLIGVGGTLDFLVGGRRRAPRWMQAVGLEWLFRAVQEPLRLGRRYLHDGIVFGPQLFDGLRHRIRRTNRAVNSAAGIHLSDEFAIEASRLDARNSGDLAVIVAAARNARRSGTAARVVGADSGMRAELVKLDSAEFLSFG